MHPDHGGTSEPLEAVPAAEVYERLASGPGGLASDIAARRLADVGLNQIRRAPRVPLAVIAHLVAEEMSMGEMMTLLKLRRGRLALVEEQVHPASSAAGVMVADLDIHDQCLLVGILRDHDVIVPHADTRLVAGDELLAVVSRRQPSISPHCSGRRAPRPGRRDRTTEASIGSPSAAPAAG